jgi:ApeA N-terminal domain 1
MNIAASGEFWLPETPDETVRGAFKADAGKQPEAVLDDALVEDPRVSRTATGSLMYARGAAGGVKASLPITMQGRLDSGESVTLVNAQNWGDPGRPFGSPRYQAHYAIVGERHTSGPEQLFSAMRFRFGDPYWLGHLQSGEAAAAGGNGSTLSIEGADDGNWLLYTSATPLTLQRLETMVESACLTLAELALDQGFEARDTWVRINEGDAWLRVYGPGANTPPKEFDYRTLLPREELTLERFANWIPINDTLDGIGRVAGRPLEGFLETQALLVTTLLEGLHRRLHKTFQQSKFPGAPPSALDSVKQAARRAAKAKAADRNDPNLDPQQVHTAVMKSISHFDDVEYIDRATDVVTRVSPALPELTEALSVADLAEHMKKSRNEMAHQLLREEKEPLAARHLRWLIVTHTTPWLLRGLLLLEAGVEPSVIHLHHQRHIRYPSACANVTQFVSELGSQLPPTTG